MRVTAAVALCGLAACGSAAQTSGEWSKLAPAGLARTEVGAARTDRSIYVVGGFVAPDRTTAAVERYDIDRNRWQRVKPMPLGLNHAAAVVYRGDLYVLGGYRGATGLRVQTDAFLRYDPGRNRWSRMPRMPTKRAALAAGVIGHRLYAVGGASAGATLRTLEIFDFRTRRWRKGPPMPTAREHLAGAVAGDRFYALAGRVTGVSNFKVAERFDPATGRWEKLPDMEKARGGIAAAEAGGKVVVVGGEEHAGTIAEAEVFDPATGSWSRLPDLPTPRHGLGAVSDGNRVFVIEGGLRPGFSFSHTLEAIDVP